LAICPWLVATRPAWAYSPEDPKVRQMVDRALKYLERVEDEDRLGGRCLIGLVFFKEGKDEEHPQIARAIDQCEEVCRGGPEDIAEDIYSAGIAAMFLAELEAEKYGPEIDKLLRYLRMRQKPGGGWGYPLQHPKYGRTGDTSMTQYAVLALWTAHRRGITVSDSMVTGVCNWLVRTQDPSGAWGYQGREPGPEDNPRVRQSEIRPSLCAAGLGSTYICGDLLGLKVGSRSRRGVRIVDGDQEDRLPPALKAVSAGRSGARSRPIEPAGRVNLEAWQRAVSDGKRWFRQNYTISPQRWPLYYLYALERYQSFRELAEGRSDPDHNWYDDGVEYLARTQGRDGSWTGNATPPISTSFAVLFLTRSTQRSIQRTGYGEGRLTGGRGLPTSVDNVDVKRGQIVAAPKGGSVADALAALEDPRHPDFDSAAQMGEELRLSRDPAEQSRQTARLRRIIKGGSYQARAAAVRLLARRRNLDDVPHLVSALRDPDPGVRQAADQGLRLISRRLDGVRTGAGDPNAQAARVEAWKRWFRSIRPDAQFLE
jgi:hypothetical protein